LLVCLKLVSFDCDFEGYAHQDTDCLPSSFKWEALSHLLWFLFLPGTVTDLYVAPSPSAVSEVLKSPNIHDLQVYGVILTVVLCLIVFGGVKIINRVSPAFLVPAVLSVFFIYIGIFASPRKNDPGELLSVFPYSLAGRRVGGGGGVGFLGFDLPPMSAHDT